MPTHQFEFPQLVRDNQILSEILSKEIYIQFPKGTKSTRYREKQHGCANSAKLLLPPLVLD